MLYFMLYLCMLYLVSKLLHVFCDDCTVLYCSFSSSTVYFTHARYTYIFFRAPAPLLWPMYPQFTCFTLLLFLCHCLYSALLLLYLLFVRYLTHACAVYALVHTHIHLALSLSRSQLSLSLSLFLSLSLTHTHTHTQTHTYIHTYVLAPATFLCVFYVTCSLLMLYFFFMLSLFFVCALCDMCFADALLLFVLCFTHALLGFTYVLLGFTHALHYICSCFTVHLLPLRVPPDVLQSLGFRVYLPYLLYLV